MPDKTAQSASQKAKARQASLLEAQEDKADGTDKLVARAFDSDPNVRLKVAQELASLDDPRAIFALIELSSDKDEAVKETAQRSLGNFKEEKEEIVSIGKLLSERKAQPAQAAGAPQTAPQQAMRANMMPAIERLFAHYEPKKRESAKRKLLPSLQKLFGFRPEELDPLKGIDKISQSSQQQVSQQQESEAKPQNAANFPFGKHEEPREAPHQAEDEVELGEDDFELVGGERHTRGPVPLGQEGEIGEEPVQPDEIYHYALHIATTPGMGKADMKREQNRLISDFKKRADLAFKLALAQAKEEGFATFSGVKPGMKKLSFSAMPIAKMADIAYGAKKKPYVRISLWDEKKEMPVLVPRERAMGIGMNDRICLKRVDADFIVETNEVVLIVGSKSELHVIK
jgi:hypothetical protein